MRLHPRIRRIAMRPAFGVSLLILVLWGVSLRDCWATTLGDGHIRLTDGTIYYYPQFVLPPGLHRFSTMRQLGLRLPRIRYEPAWGKVVEYVFPLWVALALPWTASCWSWLRNRRRIPPGHCRVCGYDLTGNVSGVCPECGHGIEN